MQCNVIMLMSRMRGQPVSLYMNRKLERQHTMAPLAALMGPFASYLYEMYDKWCDITCEQVDRTMHEAISHWWSGALPICTKISVENFRQMVLVFTGTENRNGIELYHLQNTGKVFAFSGWRLALVIQTNGTEKFGRFGKNGKSILPRKVLPFSRKISTGMNRSIWILPVISGFSIQMVSVPGLHASGVH